MRQTFVGKVMSLLLNMLSRLVITFHPRSKHLLISWLQSLSAVILEQYNLLLLLLELPQGLLHFSLGKEYSQPLFKYEKCLNV